MGWVWSNDEEFRLLNPGPTQGRRVVLTDIAVVYRAMLLEELPHCGVCGLFIKLAEEDRL